VSLVVEAPHGVHKPASPAETHQPGAKRQLLVAAVNL